jgi:hypothetical protein
MNIATCIYRHIASGKFYQVLGIARKLENPHRHVVVYKQLYDSVLRGTDVELPYGTWWVRDIKEFEAKFTLVENANVRVCENGSKVVQADIL